MSSNGRSHALAATEGDPEVVRAARAEQQARKRNRRQIREHELATKILTLPTKKYGVSISDWGWRDEAWSEATGTDRNPDYTLLDSNEPEEIITAIKNIYDAVCSPDHAHFMWTTNQHLAIAIHVLEGLGFTYKSHAMWLKPKAGMGRWFRSRHELLLVGTRGNVVCPAPGEQWESIIEGEPAMKGLHSSKPERVLEMIEAYFPTVPKIELNRRGAPRQGWAAYGNEVEAKPDAASPEQSADKINEKFASLDGASGVAKAPDDSDDLTIPDFLRRSRSNK